MNEKTNRTLVLFTNDGCNGCNVVHDILSKEWAYHHRLFKYKEIDCSENPELARLYNVQGVPFVIMLDGETAFDSLIGVHHPDKYKSAIEKWLTGEW